MTAAAPAPGVNRFLLWLAALAVMFAAADTYVVVLSLPDMMSSVGLSVEQLQRAAPIISGFLLGYVAMLPLIGRIADLRGRVPVLIAALIIFAFGSLITAVAYDLDSLVAGRFLQGLGGGGLVPVTLALVADIYPAEDRGVPLGVVGAVQELGSVLGPLYGALVLAVGTWRDIFLINLAAGLVLAAAVATLVRRTGPRVAPRRRIDLIGLGLFALATAGMVLVMTQPTRLITDVTLGAPFVPFTNPDLRWWSPIGVVTILLGVIFVGWCLTGPNRLIDLRGWIRSAREADLLGAAYMSIMLGGIILAFATADPTVAVFSPIGPWLLGLSALAAILLIWHNRRAPAPLVPRGAMRRTPAWGALVISFFVGAALIAALTDIPVYARLSSLNADQLGAALVLIEFLIALPIGALIGGWLTRFAPLWLLSAAGMTLAGIGFVFMANWDYNSLEHWSSSVELALTGFGFGVVLAPINAALLATTPDEDHGVASALLVVSRMVGMLVGISALTTLGLRGYYAREGDLPSPNEVCGGTSTKCQEFLDMVANAGMGQLHLIFAGAAVCAFIAAICSAIFFMKAPRAHSSGLLASG
jgi:MFS family permease